MMLEMNPCEWDFILKRQMSYSRIHTRGDSTFPCGTPLCGRNFYDGLYAVMSVSFWFFIKLVCSAMTFSEIAICFRVHSMCR
jgi:hypothetical protein